ncbi:MAG: glycosyltransferase family 9 protein [Ktedonobacteraceae bacterium]|nr:glycosyltransferase family 9 protein [Ktedonobacteraceae bacterium]
MHYLIVRPGAIGDTLLTFPVIQALRAQSSNPHITFVGNAAVLPLALAAHIAEEVFDYDSRQWSALFATDGIHSPTLQALLQHIDVAICWLRDPEQIVERNLRSLGIQRIVIAPGHPSHNEHIHIVDYLARTLNLQQPVPFNPLFYTPDNTHIRDHSMQPIAIHPGSGGSHKCWPITHFASLIIKLWQRNIPILLLAGPADSERMTTLLSLLPLPSSPTLLTTLIDVPLQTIAQQLQDCVGYIGNDAGITHLAALLALPTIVLFGPSDPHIWRPYGSTTHVLHELILTNLQVDTVLYTVDEFFYHMR